MEFALRDDTHMTSTLRGGGGYGKNEMSDVGGRGLASVLGVQSFFFFFFS